MGHAPENNTVLHIATLKMNILWIHSVDGTAKLRNGASLRVLKIAEECIAANHRVYLGVLSERMEEQADQRYLTELKTGGTITDFFRIQYPNFYEGRALTPAHILVVFAYRVLLGYPPIVNLVMRKHQRAAIDSVNRIVDKCGIDVLVIGDGRLDFLVSNQVRVPKIIDFIDSWTLAAARKLKLDFRHHRWRRLADDLQHLLWAVIEDRYYGRRSAANIVVSPIDQRVLSLVSGKRAETFVVQNGVCPASAVTPYQKEKGRIVFSGNMNFAPNYEAALWFIDEVLPRITSRMPHAKFVVAGASPIPELLAKKSTAVVVTGYVDDLAAEIGRSELYVAPMVSGGGFKNKVAEALLAGTYVASTAMGVEFLPLKMRKLMIVADQPAELADQIIEYLAAPQDYQCQLEKLRQLIATEFTWKARAEEFLRVVELARNSHSA